MAELIDVNGNDRTTVDAVRSCASSAVGEVAATFSEVADPSVGREQCDADRRRRPCHQRPPQARLRQLEEQVEVPVCVDTAIVLLGGPHIGLDRFAPCLYDIESQSRFVS
jgi:hypothetical protein